MKTDALIAAQLLKLVIEQPQRLAKSAISDSLFEGPFAELFLEIRRMWTDGQQPTSLLLSASQRISEEARTLAASFEAYGEPQIAFDDAVKVLAEQRTRREFAALCRKAHDDIYAKDSNADQVVRSHCATIARMVHGDTSLAIKPGYDFTAINAKMTWQAANPGKVLGIETGFWRLDTMLNGLNSGKLYVVGARPSVGKTSLSGCITANVCSESPNIRVLDFSIEMDADELRELQQVRLSGVNTITYLSGQWSGEQIASITAAQRTIKKWNWGLIDGAISIDDIEAIAFAEFASLAPGEKLLVKIDYLQLLTGGVGKNTNERIGNITGRLKRLSKSVRSPIVLLSQLKRIESTFESSRGSTKHRKPVLEDLRDSGNIEQDADTVLLLDRDIINEPTEAIVIVAKQRGGRTHPGLPFSYHPQTTTFTEKPL